MSNASEPIPLELVSGVAMFNGGAYYDCHETLEALWKRERRPIRGLYQGLIQIATGLHHLQRHNLRGARLCLERGIERVRPFAPQAMGMDLASLIRDTNPVLAEVHAAEAGDGVAVNSSYPLIHHEWPQLTADPSRLG